VHSATQKSSPIASAGDEAPDIQLLVVEDSKVEQERLRAMLLNYGYQVLTADRADQALELLQTTPIDLVLSDWRMPGMNGIELCRAIRATADLRQPYFVLVTGQNTGSDLVAGLDAGADDFIAKPFNSEELRVRVKAGARLTELRRRDEQRNTQLVELLERQAADHGRIREELALAARMQRSALPAPVSPFPGIEVGTLFQPAVEVAGDSYGFFPLDDRHLAFFIVDVAGHGVAAAMVSFTVSRLLSPDNGAVALLNSEPSTPAQPGCALPGSIVPAHRVVDALNRHFLGAVDTCHYFTMIYGVLDIDSGRGELCQAGHPHPLIVSASGGIERVGEGGFPVGLLEQATYDSVAFKLGIGERLMLFSDGLADCRRPNGEHFGEQRLAKLLARTSAESLPTAARCVDKAVTSWRDGTTDHDDLSLLGIGRLGAGDAHG
jgi:sigma-B regulation protein RsbU (phosphoserine phosphatase)